MASHEDAKLILRLYELRREEKMRAARKWFFAAPWSATLEEFYRHAPMGSDENAYFRMVVTYWDMAASFVAQGILDAEAFYLGNNVELLYVWSKIHHLLPEFRAASKNNYQYKSLEQVGASFAAWMKTHSPEGPDAMMARARGAAAPPR